MTSPTSLAAVLAGEPGVRLVRRPFEPDDEISFAVSPPPAEDAEVVEGEEMRALPVQTADESGFTHFIDGAQKARLAFFDGQHPGYVAHIGAAVMERVDREMLEVTGERREDAIYAPRTAPSLSRLTPAFDGSGIDVRGVVCEDEAGMSAMSEEVRNRIGTDREELELELKRAWLESGADGWLLADGGIAQLFPFDAPIIGGLPHIVGVVKSHRKQYFCSAVTTDVVLSLKTGERSSAFIASAGRQRRDRAYSWYLRLREDEFESPSFGLIRVEMPPVDETLDWVDRVSSWLMAERAPLSLPDVRYDRMVYPIRRVEMYLKSLQPSEAALASVIGV